ncbi:TPA: glycosyltransferase family 4 protein [Proteus mirabilis]|uniref:glycosyltransferase family 4 protein n=1 Tax=Proteus mirabilis TaxID=584 RepID=UPI001A2DE160|nr:glycosyltransferase family 4 protein [Proteus mirabilis]MCT8228457.1 glycosyltransferase family 4 protein [Proteus mirabilis]MDF7247341.1 glycosyltransferase family 4 protein [Proteus mirabilis]MDF7406870.1 glycosyltransferase family 4 protein [Proteus mirabilis]MDF7431553.1 glycosyltransferase family 4 protein [Proteus mirabilis]HAT4484164.1 glycosyltransferase family 4 protein [Proteus mirabilis]
MKIIYCIPSLHNSGGMERVLTLKVNYLVKKINYDITILTYTSNENIFFNLDKKVKVVNISNSYMKLYFDIFNFIKDNKPNYFISLGGKDRFILPFIKDKNIKTILEWHFSYTTPIRIIESKKGNIFSKKKALMKMFFNTIIPKYCDAFVVLTEKDKKLWEKSDINNISVIPNPCTFEDQNERKKHLFKDNEILNFINIGRLDYQKGLFDLVEIFYRLKDISSKWKLNIYGDGPLKKLLLEKINSLGLSKNISIHKPTRNIYDIYRASDCFVMSSYYEGLPMVLIESLYFSLPIISFDCDCGPSDIVHNNINGYLIKRRSIEDYSNSIRYLIDNRNKLKEFSNNSKELSNKYFIDNIMSLWINLLKK